MADSRQPTVSEKHIARIQDQIKAAERDQRLSSEELIEVLESIEDFCETSRVAIQEDLETNA
jgi:hypothetical protein